MIPAGKKKNMILFANDKNCHYGIKDQYIPIYIQMPIMGIPGIKKTTSKP